MKNVAFCASRTRARCSVEAFCAGVADSGLTEVQASFLVASEHLDYLFDRLRTAAHRVVRPRSTVLLTMMALTVTLL